MAAGGWKRMMLNVSEAEERKERSGDRIWSIH